MAGKPLDPSLHLIVGILVFSVSAYTLLFTQTPNPAAMKLFMFVGLGFIGLAAIKYLIRYMKSGSLKKSEQKLATKLSGINDIESDYHTQLRRQQQLQQNNNPNQKHPIQANHNQARIIACPLCQTRNYSTSYYCHMCGYKLR